MPQYIGSTTPIVHGVTYASRWVLKDIFKTVTGSVFADQAGTLLVEQSGNGTNADISASYPVVASTGLKFSEDLVLPWVRVRMTNTAGSDQTVLRLFVNWTLGEMP